MKKCASLLCILISIALPIASTASPRILSWAALSEDSLLGPVRSTAQLEQAMRGDDTLIGRAATKIGLTNADYVAVRTAVERRHMRYVTLPRHLDAMAGMHDGVTFADRDVIVPEGVHGWEVDLTKDDGTVRVFFPNTCGNISTVFDRYRVAAATYTPPSPAPLVAAMPSPNIVTTPEAIATAVPELALTAPPIVPAQHAAPHLGWLGALLVPLIVGLGSHGGSGGTSGVVPVPIHTICPTVPTKP